ncbi:MAG: nicotinate-nucleotide adenylyltransferase, partial [Candidatus Aureabacteria bacterium]|nr:nicotinate-nucleotide adenylyltransferase [Candidatus Auribacterota bacterium]
MTAPSYRIGILGGTFNPVHNGHLLIAREALRKFRLDRILFIPVALPPHKAPADLAPASNRLAMLGLALRGKKKFSISRLEIARGGKSYTARTVRELKKRFPRAEIYLIVGADNLQEIASWKRIGEVVRRGRFIVVTRPGFPLRDIAGENAAWAGRILSPGADNLIELELPVSSSGIRERARRGMSLKGLVPPAVSRYIREKALYGGRTQGSPL